MTDRDTRAVRTFYNFVASLSAILIIKSDRQITKSAQCETVRNFYSGSVVRSEANELWKIASCTSFGSKVTEADWPNKMKFL